mmetsp:Transcript_30732/g.53124  ORF Transcript_30732/g.53124 Transcript_30732/m.53124 type:complete len:291 (+) Transcript_30732:81-953(+)
MKKSQVHPADGTLHTSQHLRYTKKSSDSSWACFKSWSFGCNRTEDVGTTVPFLSYESLVDSDISECSGGSCSQCNDSFVECLSEKLLPSQLCEDSPWQISQKQAKQNAEQKIHNLTWPKQQTEMCRQRCRHDRVGFITVISLENEKFSEFPGQLCSVAEEEERICLQGASNLLHQNILAFQKAAMVIQRFMRTMIVRKLWAGREKREEKRKEYSTRVGRNDVSAARVKSHCSLLGPTAPFCLLIKFRKQKRGSDNHKRRKNKGEARASTIANVIVGKQRKPSSMWHFLTY